MMHVIPQDFLGLSLTEPHGLLLGDAASGVCGCVP